MTKVGLYRLSKKSQRRNLNEYSIILRTAWPCDFMSQSFLTSCLTTKECHKMFHRRFRGTARRLFLNSSRSRPTSGAWAHPDGLDRRGKTIKFIVVQGDFFDWFRPKKFLVLRMVKSLPKK